MPKAPRQIGTKRARRDTTGLVLCRCRARCTKVNPATGKFEGPGVYVSPKTRVRHRRDERLSALLAGAEANAVVHEADSDDDADNQRAWEELIRTHLDILQDTPIIYPGRPLQFSNNPRERGSYEYEYDDETGHLPESPNSGVQALDTTAPENRAYLNKENTLWEICRTLDSFEQLDSTRALRDDTYQQLVLLEREKAFRWETLRQGNAAGPYYNTEIFYRKRTPRSRAADAAAVVTLALQYHHFLPRRGCEVLLAGIKDILSPAWPPNPEILRFPKDPRPLSSRFNLDPITQTYVSCPQCHCLYYFDPVASEVPDSCTFRQSPTSEQCSSPLWKDVDRGPLGKASVPIRKYIHQGLKPWLGRMLSRPGMEKVLEEYPRGLLANCDGSEIQDIWQGSVFRNIKDSSGVKFFPGPQKELRLAFSMSVDGFATFQMKTAKQSASSTGIWLVLLNLPWHLRYLPQNMYLAGVIPGPNKPSNDQINHYLDLVVSDMKALWRPGVYFSRTYEHRGGRLCKGMLIPLICDLLGAHQVIGYPGAPTAHYFCTCCELDIDDINIIDRNEWPKKDLRHIRRYAQIYKEATSQKDQQAIFEACGWRWSPLFELEYWDPSMFTVIDSMHAIDLNLLKHHIQRLFQIDLLHDGGGALRPPSLIRVKRVVAAKVELRSLEKCQALIFENVPFLLYELLQYHRKILYSFCLDYDIRPPGQSLVTGTRWILARSIYEWRQQWVEASNSLRSFLERYPRLSVAQQSLIDDQEDEVTDASDSEAGDDQQAGKDVDGGVAGNGEGSEHHEADGVRMDASSALPGLSTLRRHAKKMLALVNEEDALAAVYKGITVRILAHFCDVLSLERPPVDVTKRRSQTAKQELFHLVLTAIKSDVGKRQDLEAAFSLADQPTAGPSAFLGKDVMEAVWKDMSRTRLPSWLTRAPYDWGTSRRGKLSADNWRIICCIHLPITLIRLFGASQGRPRDLLDNFMELVTAVRIATMRKSSNNQVSAYTKHILAYTQGVLDLYPDYSILPSHHAALHIGDMLHRFGPKHSHDSPHYERFINFFHHMNTNNKSGEVESTFLRTAVRNANLLSLLVESTEDQALVSEMLIRMHSQEKERIRGFRLAQALDASHQACHAVDGAQLPHELSPAEWEALHHYMQTQFADPDNLSSSCQRLDAISYQDNIYASWNSSKYRDSAVLFHLLERERVGIIQKIFFHRYLHQETGQSKDGVYLVLKTFEQVDGEDRFRRYGHAGGFACKPSPTQLNLVPLQNIACHVALTEMTEEGIVHALPINRTVLSMELELDQGANAEPPGN